MSYVRQLLSLSDDHIDQRIWKHRSFVPENDRYVCQGRAKAIDLSIPCDIGAAVSDFVPLCRWAGNRKNLILHTHSRMGLILASLTRNIIQAPVVAHVHALGNRPAIYHKLWRLTRAKVIFNSRKTCLHYGHDPADSMILTPTISWPAAPQKTKRKSRYMACSSFFGWKNVHVIVEAFRHLAADDREAELHIYGLSPEPLEPAYQERVVQMAKAIPSVKLQMWDPDWLNQIRENDIFVHAAETEPFGIVLLEAFAKGCKMVIPQGTFLDDLPEPHRSDGVFRSPSVTPENFAGQMKRAAESNGLGLWEQRQPVAELFAISRTASTLAALYRSLGNASSKTAV